MRPDSALTKAACTAEAASTGTLIGDGDVGATDGLAAFGGGLVAVEGAVADALALHAGRIVRALQLPRQELRADIARHQFLGRHGELDVAAEPFVFVDDEGDGDGDAGVADSAGL